MFPVLATLHLKKLNILLQSNFIYYVLILIAFLNIIIFTKCIKYDTKLDLAARNVTGKIISYDLNEKYLSFIIKNEEKVKATYYFKNNEEYKYFFNLNLYGASVNLQGEFKKPLNNTIPNTFNYKKYLYDNKIYVLFKAKNIEIKETTNFFYQLKNSLINRINEYNSKIYLKLFILGDKSELSDELYDAYKINGIAHLLAVSGMHITFFAYILEKLFIRFRNKTKRTLIITFLLFYSFLTNFAVSVLRCVLFYILKEVNKIYNLKISNIRLLLISAFLLLIYDPFYIYSIAFLYSFIITFGLMYSFNKERNIFKSLFLTSVIAFLFSVPITINLNYEINISSIIINLICVPLVTYLIYPLSLLSLFIKGLDNFLMLFVNFFEFLNSQMLNYSLILNVPKMSFIFMIGYYLCLCLFFKVKHKIYLFLILINLGIVKIIPKLDSSFYVVYLDVGQGDSSLLISPYKKEVVMIDTGGNLNYSVSNNSILYLKSLGINKLDSLVLTHGDSDHAFETLNINKKLKIKTIVFNNNKYNNLEKEILKLKLNKTKDVNLKYFKAKNLNESLSDDENASSLGFKFNIQNYIFLFMGDIPIKETKIILKKNDLTCDFLKLSHHGSKYSTDEIIINQIKPRYVLISAGRDNLFKHPHKEIISLLELKKIKYYTTQQGSIVIKINKNKNYNISSYNP